MQLVYSTSELSLAERLSLLLEDAGLETHISNTHSAQMPGFPARFTPGFVGVWLVNQSDLAAAQGIMQSNGFIAPSPVCLCKATTNRNFWLTASIAALVIVIIATLVASGP